MVREERYLFYFLSWACEDDIKEYGEYGDDGDGDNQGS